MPCWITSPIRSWSIRWPITWPPSLTAPTIVRRLHGPSPRGPGGVGALDHALALVRPDARHARSSSQINSELIKWCEAFLDEGHATWSMPGRDQGFYGAWKALAAQEWSPCGITDSRRKIARPARAPGRCGAGEPGYPWDSRRALGRTISRSSSRPFPGGRDSSSGARNSRDYDWQQAYPASLVQFLAIRLWYVRELVQKACREELGIEGQLPTPSRPTCRTIPREYFLRKEQVAGRLPAAYAEQVDRLSRQQRATNGRSCPTAIESTLGRARNESLRRGAAAAAARLPRPWKSSDRAAWTALRTISRSSSIGWMPFLNRTMARSG